jgi:hypothetical protein
MNLRDRLLSKDVNLKIETKEIDGEVFGFKELTIKKADGIKKACTKISATGVDFDIEAQRFLALIYVVVDPETGDYLFNEADKEVILSQPAGGTIDKLINYAVAYVNPQDVDAKKNNLEATA